MVFYRKYRPETLEELDSEEVREKLLSILSKGSAHALLFTGPKGLGKTSAARIVAKIVNCEKLAKDKKLKTKNQSEPCNKCSQCVSITSGTNIDVLEIDGASNRGIDEIRDLREKVRLSPARALKKIYIIDEVHMLTTEAFNALLKTLEEPPAHVVFVLCTTEPHKVPPTIASRCFQVAFKKASRVELVRSLTRIVKSEKIAIDQDALSSICDLADGSFRDAAKILEEFSTKGRKKVTKEMVEQEYQISNISSYIDLMLGFLAERDAKKAIQLVGKLIEQGVDMKYFLEQLIFKLHNLLLDRVGVIKNLQTSLSFDIQEIKELTELLTKASSQLKFAVLSQLPLEMTIIQWCMQQGTQVEDEKKAPVTQTVQDLDPSTRATFLSTVDDIWPKLIEKIKPYNHSVAGLLRGCSLKNFDGKKLEVEAKFKFHKEKLDETKVRVLIEKVLEEITGEKVKIAVVLKV
ncbi:MAG: DNA polymerase III subunit gamma/tau [Patescibacteria group bacterium]|nr:DNA polymerase III subunit gamma/tau [Patescibacteria group bacterium]